MHQLEYHFIQHPKVWQWFPLTEKPPRHQTNEARHLHRITYLHSLTYFLPLSIREGTISLPLFVKWHYKVDHLLHRLLTLLISFPYICLMYFMAFCIGFLWVEFPFSEGPLLTQPWCTSLSSCFSFVFFFCTPSRHLYPFWERMLLKLLWPKLNYSRFFASQVKLLMAHSCLKG